MNKKKVLIINCYFSEFRLPVKLSTEIPDTLVPILLAGAFKEDFFEIKLYNEVSKGFIEIYEPELLSWPDVIVMTSLTMSFDRLLHVSAYARSYNKNVITIAGGHSIRSFRRYSKKFFDYVCYGDVEEICDVIADIYGPECVDRDMPPRYDLAPWNRWLCGFAESTRYCTHRCDFCSLSAETHRYKDLGLKALERQIIAMGKKYGILFLDNQFYGPTKEKFHEKLVFLKDMKKKGHFRRWSGICSNSFLWDEENIRLAKEAGCISLFIGVESFDDDWLRRVNKGINNHHAQIQLIKLCIEHGILFQYGIVVDPSERRMADICKELDFITTTKEVPSPQYIFSAIPLPGTQLFRDRAGAGLILPNAKIRDLEGSTLTLKSLDPEEEVGMFLKNFRSGHSGYLWKMMRHQLQFFWYYRKHLDAMQVFGAAACFMNLFWPSLVSDIKNILIKDKNIAKRTHVCTTDPLDCVYTPRLRVASEYESYFKPTQITDFNGKFNEDLVEDLFDDRVASQKEKKGSSSSRNNIAKVNNNHKKAKHKVKQLV